MEALDALVKAGKVRALGASEMYAYQFHNLQAVADAMGGPDSPACSATTICSTAKTNASSSPYASSTTLL